MELPTVQRDSMPFKSRLALAMRSQAGLTGAFPLGHNLNPCRIGALRSTKRIMALSIYAMTLLSSAIAAAQQLASVDSPKEDARIIGPAVSMPAPVYKPLPAPVVTRIEVHARYQAVPDVMSSSRIVTREEVLTSAGTWGDFTRYMQLLPGVVGDSDLNNEVMVRGGNPSENLFVVDGIEVPNINHFSLEGNTGGFTSMLDTSAIDSFQMKPGPYDVSYSSRLSSLIEIHTRDGLRRAPVSQLDAGVSGVGGMFQRPIGTRMSVLFSAHHSILNLVTNDIGVNGVPIYTNGVARVDWAPGSNDRISILNLSGADSIDINPQPCDPAVSSSIRTSYGGLRSTSGMVWQHFPSARSSSTFTVSHSSQNQDITQQWQTVAKTGGAACLAGPVNRTTVYQELTHDGVTAADYHFAFERGAWIFSMGAGMHVTQYKYGVAQPVGAPSPFNPNPAWSDSDVFNRNFASGQSAAFLEVIGHPFSRWTTEAAVREEWYALTAAHFLTSETSLEFRASEHQSISVNVGRSGQLAPVVNILSYEQNKKLSPLAVNQLSVAASVWNGGRITVNIGAFSKRYSHEPVSTEYPSLMLANMVDMLGQQFTWLPMRTGGYGRAQGFEFMMRAHTASRLRLLASATYSRTRYAASDGILRPGNYDFPLVVNGIGNIRLSKGIELSVRDSYATGRPYTPFNLVLSREQERGIYDLTQINARRAQDYNRVDADINRSYHLGKGVMKVNIGAENVLNRKNFLGYAWLDSCNPKSTATACAGQSLVAPGVPEVEFHQMMIFPSAWAHYQF